MEAHLWLPSVEVPIIFRESEGFDGGFCFDGCCLLGTETAMLGALLSVFVAPFTMVVAMFQGGHSFTLQSTATHYGDGAVKRGDTARVQCQVADDCWLQ